MPYGIILNEDPTHFCCTRNEWGIKIDKEEMESFVEQYANTHVTDLILCVNSQLSAVPSKILESFTDKFHQKIENGNKVDYSNNILGKTVQYLFTEDIDFFKVCINRLKEIDINPWLSIRMNDCHNNADETSFLLPNFFHENPHLRRVTHRPPIGYFDRCLDFAQQVIYDRMLNYFEEFQNRA